MAVSDHLGRQSQVVATGSLPALLVGRDAELGQLRQAFSQALQGQRQIVFISGEPGIGKTTVVEAFLGQLPAQSEAVWIAQGQCVEQYGAGEAYLPILEALGRLGRGADEQELVAVLTQYAPTWLAQLPALVPPAEREALQRTLFGATRGRMLREMAEALEVLASRRPLVVTLEDLHWSDQSTLELLAYIMRREGSARLLILGTFRSTEVVGNDSPLPRVVQDLQGRGHGEEIRLGLLDEAQVDAYLRVRFETEREAEQSFLELAQWVYQRTEGNPLFIVMMVEHLRREGVLIETDGQWQLGADWANVANVIPDSLRPVIERQFEGLPAAQQQLLEVASVVGVEFGGAAVAVGSGQAIETVEKQCTGLAAEGQFVRPAGLEEWPDGSLAGRYRFLHALYQHVLYERLSEVRRVQLHRSIATRKAAAYGSQASQIAGELARHFEAGQAYLEAINYCEHAGTNALQRSAHTEAIHHLTKGLGLLRSQAPAADFLPQELRLQLALSGSLAATQGYAAHEVKAAYAQALDVCQQVGRTPQLFASLWGLFGFYLVRAELDQAYDLAEQMLQLARHSQDPQLVSEASFVMGQVVFARGELVPARAYFSQALSVYDPQKHRDHISHAVQDLEVACLSYEARILWLIGYPDQALQKVERALDIARRLSHATTLAWALNRIAWIHYFRRERQATLEHAEEAVRFATEQGIVYWAAVSRVFRGWALTDSGQQTKRIRHIRQGLDTLRAIGAEIGQPDYLPLLAEAYTEGGQTEKSLAVITEALTKGEAAGERVIEAELYRLKGELLLNDERGTRNDERQKKAAELSAVQHSSFRIHRFEEVEACFQRALETAQQQEAKSLELRAALSLARLWCGQGKSDDARQILEESYGWFTEGFDTPDLQEAEAFLKSLGSTVRRKPAQDSPSPAPVELPQPILPREHQRELAPDPRPNPQSPIPNPQSPIPNPQSPTPNPQSLIPNLLRREGEYWTLAFEGQTCRIKDSRGMQYLAQLLYAPHQEFLALDLAANQAGDQAADVQAGSSDVGDSLDPQAKAAYRQRVAELQEELAEARTFNDVGRIEKLQAELMLLSQELTQAVGLGGGPRKAASPAERARVNVTRRLKAAIKKISQSHPDLGQHLTSTIKTGVYCRYTPDPRLPMSWRN